MNGLPTRATALPAGVRLDFLDALRGLAALYVVIYHMILVPDPDLGVPYWAQLFAHNGGTGVTLFFVVSAFSLFYTMPLRLREPRPWLSFFIHRFFRIAPLFYLWIALTLIRDRIVFDATHGIGEILASMTFTFNLVPQGQQGFVWASWTIGVEMLFYALFPLFYLFARNVWQAVTLALSLLVAWTAIKALTAYFPVDPASVEAFVQWSVLKHLPVFACGAIAYHLFVVDGRTVPVSRDAGTALTVGAVTLYVALLNGWLPAIFGDQYYWQAVIYTMFLLGLAAAPLRAVVNRLTSYLGKISYSLYLSHPTIILLLSPVYGWLYRQGLPLSVTFLASAVITVSCAIFVSELTFRFVESPFIRMGKKVNLIARNKFLALVTDHSISRN